MNTPMDSTLPWPTITPSTISERAPMKQSSSMTVGLACSGSSTPPMPTPPDRCTFLPIWAQEPTVTQVSTMVPSSTKAPMFTNDGISTTFLPTKDPRRTIEPGTARKPASRNWSSVQSPNLEGTLSHQGPVPGARFRPESPPIMALPCRRKDSSTAFFSHWRTTHSPPTFSATRSLPPSSRLDGLLHALAHGAGGHLIEFGALLPGRLDLGFELFQGQRAVSFTRTDCRNGTRRGVL